MARELKLMLYYVRKYWWRYILGLAVLYGEEWVAAKIPRLSGELTDGLTTGAFNIGGVWNIAIRLLGMGLVVTVGCFLWRVFLFGTGRKIEQDLRGRLFAHLETMSLSWYNEHKTGDLMALFTNDVRAIRGLMGMTVISSFDATVMLMLVLINMILFVNLKLTLITVIPLILILFSNVWFSKQMHRRFLVRQEAFAELTSQAQEAISGIRVIKGFVQERQELAAFAKANRNNHEKNIHVIRLTAFFLPLLDLLVGISLLLTLVYGGRMTIFGEISIGQFVAFSSYVMMLIWPMIAVGESVSGLSQGLASLRRVSTILEEKSNIVDEGDPAITSLKGDIEFRDLTFRYPGTSETHPALEHVSIHVSEGETLAVFGRTGCGKTTMVNLLERLWDTDDPDMIRVDGHPLREIPLQVLHRDIAYVPQDSFLFSDTIRNNIAFGVDKADNSEIIEAAKAADIHDNIMEFPKQYDTLLGERGVTISGGQKQRISIARALMKDAPVLILDDSLSAVDTDTEERILTRLKEIRRGRTTIIISHRISTIQHADHILVLEDGKPVEYGTHDELMVCSKVYSTIYENQQLEKQLLKEYPDLPETQTTGGGRL